MKLQSQVSTLSTESGGLGIDSPTRVKEMEMKNVAEDIGHEQEQSMDHVERLRLLLRKYLEISLVGRMYSQFIIVLSVLSCFQYLYQLYAFTDDPTLLLVELFLAILFLCDWCLLFFVADNKLTHVKSFFSVVDLATCIPIFVTYGHTCPAYDQIEDTRSGIYYILCGLSSTRILRALRLRRSFVAIEDDVQRFLADMCLQIVVMILFSSALMKFLEPEQNNVFHVWTYYTLVTMTTVGYGDISPVTDLGRFAAMAIIMTAIIVVPKMTNELVEKVNEHSIYARAYYTPKSKRSMHVLVCGDLRSCSMMEFLEELFHEDHEMMNLHAVILHPSVPSQEMLHILRDIHLSLSVTYLEGNTLNEKDLHRALAHEATAIFIMTNKFSTDPDKEDSKTILQQFSIQRFLRLHAVDQTAFFCLQLIRPENKRHLAIPLDSDDTHLVICMNEIKLGVLAKAVISPGANTLIMNLLSSFADDADDNGNKSTINGIETLEEDDDENDWVGEYKRGCDWEIYTTDLHPSFEGCMFCLLSEMLYQRLGVVLFALEIEDLRRDKSNIKMLLNPSNFVIPAKDGFFKIAAFVMAKNKAQSDLTFSNSPQEAMYFDAGGVGAAQLELAKRTADSGGGDGNGGNDATNSAESGGDEVLLRPVTVAAWTLQGATKKQAWQAMLLKHQAEKSSHTQQEEKQTMDSRFLRENYYTKDSHNDIADVYIKSSLLQEMPYVDNHIIIIGKALSNLYDLILPLRAKNLGPLMHIIIVYPADFPISVWQRISIFESIWIVRGSALEEADFRRAGIFKAKHVILLADASDNTKGASDALVDADAIFAYQCVRRMNEHAHVVVEMVRHANVAYLDPESGMNGGDVDFKMTPQFASGALIVSELLDTLVCQAFYNTKIIEVLNKLIGGVAADRSASTGNGGGTMMGSALYQISLPDGLESRTYGSLYKLLSRRGQIPLGILRGVFANTKTGPKANKLPYVYTNPSKDTELFTCDKIFMLSPTPIKLGRGRGNDELKELQMYENLRIKKKTTEDVIASVAGLQEDVKSFEDRHRHVEQDFAILQDNITDKFQLLFDAVHALHNANNNIAPSNEAQNPLDAGGYVKGRRFNNSTPLQRASSVPAVVSHGVV